MSERRDNNELRKLPSVDELLRSPAAAGLLGAFPRRVVVESLRSALAEARRRIANGSEAADAGQLAALAEALARSAVRSSLGPAINATGIIIHTGLGRAVLSEPARLAVEQVARGHSTLEIDLGSGRRGSRQEHVRSLLCELTGAQDALVVNNNAAAVLLAVNTLARGMEVVISRGQLVEIGGSFRMPDVIRRAGGKLVEVGTTNRTRIGDYENAVTEDTALIVRCHPSNFRMSGFVEAAPLEELVALGRRVGVPVMDDLGSGALLDVSAFGLEHEPTVQESVRAGASVVSFSGDKLLGASQAGVLVGETAVIAECRSNPIARAVRVDKLTLAALEATLRVYRYSDPVSGIPVLASISRPLAEIDRQARRLARMLATPAVDGLAVSVVAARSETGGGSLPGQTIESRAVALKSRFLSAEDMGERLRANVPPIFGRIIEDLLVLDMRTVNPQELVHIKSCVRALAD